MIKITSPLPEWARFIKLDDINIKFRFWLFSDEFKQVLNLFGYQYRWDLDDDEMLKDLNDFVNANWDFRKMQANGGERWNISNDEFLDKNRDIIIESAIMLNMVREGKVSYPYPDYILPLGGARLANLKRAELAARIAREAAGEIDKPIKIVALSGKRPINEIEIPYLQEYAPDALTEYDAINAGLEHAFGIVGAEYEEENHLHENINLQHSKRTYTSKIDGKIQIHSLSAPSSVTDRRANTLDTFKHFVKEFGVKKGDAVLLVTSQIYVPYQSISIMDYALERSIYVDCIGTGVDADKMSTLNPALYLQEMKATVNAIYSFREKRYMKKNKK